MTTKTKAFSLEPFYAGRSMRIIGINFDVIEGADIYHPRNSVLETLPAKEIDYGKLFTYTFRRFGLPNKGSDGYKDIAEWIFKTPHPDLFLILRPTPLEEPQFSIHFSAEEGISLAVHKWERADVDAWFERKLDWAEKQGLPDWMPDVVHQFAEEFKVPDATWRDVYRSYLVMLEPSPHHQLTDKREKAFVEFAAQVSKYKEIEPCPQFRKRNADLSLWADDDPLKPLALAAIEALADLKTGVRVRDMAINAFGRMEDGEGQVVNEPESAGNTVGPMFNSAPEQSIELQILARKLGNGDYGAGLSAILKLAGNDEQEGS